jgi:hypothetical protein
VNEVADSPVVLVRWPGEGGEVERLRALGVPRLLLVAPDEPAPIDEDPQQDWIRLPAADSDLWARVRSLELRIPECEVKPEVRGDGRLVHRGHAVWLPPIAERLLAVLVERFNGVVSTSELLAAGWPDGGGTTGALRIHVIKLRRAIDNVGLELALVPRRGYVLQAKDSRATFSP